MKKALSILTLLCILSALFASPAMAQASAIPNQQLSFRTGPNTRYTELYSHCGRRAGTRVGLGI